MKVLQDKRNDLLKRREVKIIIEESGNPGFVKAKEFVVKEFKAEPGLILMNNVKGKFGRDTFLIDAFIYDTKEDMEKLEGVQKIEEVKEEVKEEKVEDKKEEVNVGGSE